MAKESKKKKYQGYRLIDGDAVKSEQTRQDMNRAKKNADGRQTNDFFAKHDPVFMEACTRAKTENTARQASKYLRKRGKAYDESLRMIQERKAEAV